MRKALSISGSWWLTAGLAASGGLVYFLIGMSSGTPYEAFTYFLWHTPAGFLLYAASGLNLIAASLRIALKRLRPGPVGPETVRAMDSFIELPGDSPDPAEWLRARGMKPEELRGGLLARRGALSVIPGMVLRTGILLLMLSLPLSAFLREEAETLITEGASTTFLGPEVRLKAVEAELPSDYLQVGESSSFSLEGVRARLEFGSAEVLAGTGMPVKADGIYYRVTHMGYTLGIKRHGIDETDLLDVLPPGKTHELRDKDPVRIRLEPERTIKKGLLTGKVYDLASPTFGILKGKGKTEQAIALKAGQSRGGFGIGKPGLYVRIHAVSDPALPLLKLSIAVLLTGAALMLTRPFWYERRFIAARDGDSLLIGYSEEFLKKWGVYKFRNWTGEFLSPEEEKAS